jgi:hypothetical protein
MTVKLIILNSYVMNETSTFTISIVFSKQKAVNATTQLTVI